ncbi:MAG: ATP-binding protein, partial [Candidatus Thorarchaeota archaeon]
MVTRLMIQIDEEKCNGCGLCVPGCAEGALQIIDGKAKVVSESYCDGLGACMGECPQGALTLIEVETVPFDEEAAMKHVETTKRESSVALDPTPGGCAG